MRSITVIVFFCIIGYGESAAVFAPTARGQDCSNGTCVNVCLIDPEYGTDVEYVLPGQTVNNDGRCREFKCTDDFSLIIADCGVTASDWCEYSTPDFKLPYPHCCNKKCDQLKSDAAVPQSAVA